MSKNLTTTSQNTHFSLESEKALLGSILTLGDHFKTVMPKIIDFIDVEMFTEDKHRTIFAGMGFFFLSGSSINCEKLALFFSKNDMDVSQQELLDLVPYSAKITDINDAIKKVIETSTMRNIATIAKNANPIEEIKKELDKYSLKKEKLARIIY